MMQTFLKTLVLLTGLLLTPALWAGPLQDAAEIGDTVKIRTLVHQGADINQIDDRGIWPLLAATTYDQIDTMKLLLKLGANPNQVDQYAYSALHEAASMGYRDAAEILVDAKADINARDINGLSPMDYALLSGNPDAIEYFQQLGAIQ
jgi:ankyrin repeat protein